MKEIQISPMWKTTIHRAVFVNEEIVVYPNRDIRRLPDDVTTVVKFLFGEGAHIVEDFSEGFPKYIIRGASYVLSNVSTIDAQWSTQEIKPIYHSEETI